MVTVSDTAMSNRATESEPAGLPGTGVDLAAMPPTAHRFLRAWRERAELSQRKAGEAAGLGTGDAAKVAVSRLELGQRQLKAEAMRALARVYRCAPGDLLTAPPTQQLPGANGSSYTHATDSERALDQVRQRWRAISIREVDVRTSKRELAETGGDDAVGEWRMPALAFAPVTDSPGEQPRVVTAIGDSMAPEIPPASKLLVDLADRRPSPPGVFLVWDGLAFTVKRIEFVPFSDPPRVRILADNPRYSPYERLLAEAQIQGRVVGHWRWC